MNVKYTREDANAVMAMSALFRSLNSELEEANQLLQEHLELLDRYIEKTRELREEAEMTDWIRSPKPKTDI